MAVSLPKAGEKSFIKIPEIKYQPIVRAGPPQPRTSASFWENMIMRQKRGIPMMHSSITNIKYSDMIGGIRITDDGLLLVAVDE